jgi:aspartyl-tRNA(Asn)/glutamyl-tRNA(Gln) amidotransferase subunit B
MEKNGTNVDGAIESLGTVIESGADALDVIAAEVINKNPAEVARYKNGETKLLPFFLGQMMKASKGNADPASATAALKKFLH